MDVGRSRLRRLIALLLLALLTPTSAWEWADMLGGIGPASFQTKTLSMQEVQSMRVRDIKRRLGRTHGYAADELGRMLDKKDLIQALAFEEHKERERETKEFKRALMTRGIVVALIAVLVVLGWPLWEQLYAVASVNFVVYTDRKWHEVKRCTELRSGMGAFGILLMAIVDGLQLWLSASILLSWFTSSKYFFPTPSLPFRPAQFMGDQVASGPLSKYGLNIGPMAVSWVFRFVNGQLESFTGRALSRAYQKQKKSSRDTESPEERAARKAARKAAKKAAREDAERKRQSDQEAEEKRRKEEAEKATSNLFPTESQAERGNLEESRKAFQEQVESFNLDDLD
ncbi:unnamed protein product [Cylindrotheca closterium]|uniref:Uncharacterized protein n=1 Tax=Cylindrotheca closterium TaxID=2856 RepID=A0AAD2CSR0_9STRA|nr:unnamed protein product [Cylindrotheca closterium]